MGKEQDERYSPHRYTRIGRPTHNALYALREAYGLYRIQPDLPKPGEELNLIHDVPSLPQLDPTKPFTLCVWNVFEQQLGRAERELMNFREISDFIVSQEFVHRAELEEFNRAFFADRFAAQTVSYFTKPEGRDPKGVCTIARRQTINRIPLVAKHTEPLVGSSKTALVTTHPIGGDTANLGIVNIHNPNFRRHGRMQSYMEVIDPHILEHHDPLIIAGDSNKWTRKRQMIMDTFAERHGLTEVVFDVGTGEVDTNIFTRTRRTIFDERSQAGVTSRFGRELDVVYLRGLAVVDAKVRDIRGASDHNALFLTLRFS